MQATLEFLGSGTSMGVPTLGCTCAVCTDARLPGSRNRRTRPSLRLSYNSHTVLIDTGPDFHAQAIRAGITQVDAVLYTHHHADHILGMDDLRPLSFRTPAGIPLYADAPTQAVLRRVFEYTFRTENRYITSARVTLTDLPPFPGPIPLFGAEFQPIPVQHGRELITAYRFGAAAYLTDMSDIPEATLAQLSGLDILILDALRPQPHPSHSHLAKSIAFAEQIGACHTYFTHMSHEIDHNTVEATLPASMHLAYDGLVLPFDIA
jgi:phosphoribosyl 1,2-cyclic phosphate phosphodiesterase